MHAQSLLLREVRYLLYFRPHIEIPLRAVRFPSNSCTVVTKAIDRDFVSKDDKGVTDLSYEVVSKMISTDLGRRRLRLYRHLSTTYLVFLPIFAFCWIT